MMTKTPHISKAYTFTAVVLGVAQVALALLSWIITAATPVVHMRSMLSNEGVRWLFGQFTNNLTTPIVIWLVLLGMACGALRHSGLSHALACLSQLNYQQRVGMRFVAAELVLFVTVMALLTAIPHAILLGITGYLFPGIFASSIIPTLCFAVCVFSVSFGLISGSLRSLRSVYHCLTVGITYTVPLWLIYILGMELYCSLIFVFGGN